MRILSVATSTALALGVALALTNLAAAQSIDPGFRHKKVFGYQDPETGAFKPLNQAMPEASTQATTGTVELILSISLKTALPKGGAIVCSADVTAASENTSTFAVSSWSEQASTVATVSGSTATCTVNVPYSWPIPAASASVVNILEGAYSVQMYNTTTPYSPATTLPGIVRTSSGGYAYGSIPSTGSTSKYTLSLVL